MTGTIAQARLLARLHAECFPPAERWDETALATLLDMPGVFYCVAIDEASLPVGLALARVAADEAEILTFGIVPAGRRHGAGARLLHLLSAKAAQRGARRLFLEVSVRNEPALGLYRQAGFIEAGRRRRYYPDGSDALILALTLADAPGR